jgi:hypothetical protein
MKKAPQTRVAGVGTAVGAVILGSVMWLGCQPGTLPCEKEDWKGICAQSSAGAGGSTPSGNTGGSTGGTQGGSTGGASGGGNDAAPPADNMGARVVNCSNANWKTVKDMDKFFVAKCGTGNVCHVSAAFGDYTQPEFYKKLLDKSYVSKFDCTGSPMADMGDTTKGVIWIKVQDNPDCGGGKSGNGRMPMPPMPALSADEKSCLESYLKVIATK